jgi:hypothetical protein
MAAAQSAEPHHQRYRTAALVEGRTAAGIRPRGIVVRERAQKPFCQREIGLNVAYKLGPCVLRVPLLFTLGTSF